jgi:beta-xylosidase
LLLAAGALGCSSPSTANPGAAGADAFPQAGAAGNAGSQAGGAASTAGAGGSLQAAGASAGGTGGGGTASGGSGGGGTSSGGTGSGGAAGAGSAGGGGGSAGVGSVVTPKNPVLPGFYADPQIAAFGNKFYLYPTTDGYANWLSTQFHAFSSTNLANWKDEGVILDLGPDVSWAADKAWAPGIVLKNGTYYFYFSAGQAIGVASSTSPTGPFKDLLGKPLVEVGQYGVQAIDPYVFTDDDGRVYLYFGSSSSARVVELNADMSSFKGTPQTVSVPGFREGSVAFKRNGKYYFMFSENDTRDENYDVAYGMGSSPMGPFTKPAVNPILKKDTTQGILGTGHNSVLALPNGDYYIAYHRFRIPGGDGTHREVCIDRLEFNADDTIVPVKTTL